MRDRIIETLEWAVESREKVPACGFDELINSWDDFVLPFKDTEFPSQIFSAEEVAAIRRVDEAVAAFCNATPQCIPDTDATLQKDEWINLTVVAGYALSEMMKRGTSSLGGGGA
jgi:hypothetical protein